MDDTLDTIGKIHERPLGRDAVHVAVFQVVAPTILYPGKLVNAEGSPRAPFVGIVDPYLKGPVLAGQRCWVMLYPGTITSLRHEWTHWAFSAVPKNAKKEAMKYMRRLAAEGEVSLEELLSPDLPGSEQICFQSSSVSEELNSNPSEFWEHYEALTDRAVSPKEKQNTFFRCSC